MTGKSIERRHHPGRLQQRAAIGQPGGDGEHRLEPFPDDQLRAGRPQLRHTGAAERLAVVLEDAQDAGRLVADGVTHQRQQAALAGMEAQRAVDVSRQGGEIDAVDLREPARRGRPGDRLGGVPHLQGARRVGCGASFARARASCR